MLNRIGSYLLMLLLLSQWSTAAVLSAGHEHGHHGEVSIAGLLGESPEHGSETPAPNSSHDHDCAINAAAQTTAAFDAGATPVIAVQHVAGVVAPVDEVVWATPAFCKVERGPPAAHFA